MKAEGPSEGLRAAAREILRYLVEHPDAKDTIEGIMKWWLPQRDTEREKGGVQEAIDFLVAKGWVNLLEIASLQKIYSLNKDSLKEIKSFLSPGNNLKKEP